MTLRRVEVCRIRSQLIGRRIESRDRSNAPTKIQEGSWRGNGEAAAAPQSWLGWAGRTNRVHAYCDRSSVIGRHNEAT